MDNQKPQPGNSDEKPRDDVRMTGERRRPNWPLAITLSAILVIGLGVLAVFFIAVLPTLGP